MTRHSAILAICLAALFSFAAEPVRCRVRVKVASPLEFRNTPLDPTIDFAAAIREAGATGVLDPNSIQVVSARDGNPVPFARTDEFAYGDKGRVEWVARDPKDTEFEVRFHVVPRRPRLAPQAETPLIGVGDLLRWNSGKPRPVNLYYAAGMADLDGDGRADLFGCWNYAYRPGDPWDGVICYPRVGPADAFEFGDLTRLRHADKPDSAELRHFTGTYMAVDFADFNRDGKLDLVLTRSGSKTAAIFLNTGRREASGMPIFTPSISVPVASWEACRAVDLNGDGVLDLVVNGEYIRNLNRDGWPFQPDKPVTLDAGRLPCFLDLDGDGRLDAICLTGSASDVSGSARIAWRKNLGGDPPRFGPEQLLDDIKLERCTFVAAARDGKKTCLLVQHDMYQQIAFFELLKPIEGKPRFEPRGRAGSKSAVSSVSDQAWPCVCDWNGDGVPDLLVGGGYGWPRIIINEGTAERPRYAEPTEIEADGKPIRFLRDDILGPPNHWHNMGYNYPLFVRWDDDDLPDLVIPNETNRIFWYKNIGTRKAPRFGPRRQVLVEGYPDSPEVRKRSAERSVKDTYALEKEQPFFWRTGAAVADFTGDGLADLVTMSGDTRQATLFVQERDAKGGLRLRRDRVLKLKDGRPIDDRILTRKSHWTESFRAVDWDGDGRMDLIYALAGVDAGTQDFGSIFLLRNCGTKTDPVFELPETMCRFGQPIRVTAHGPHPWVGDLDGDGQPDLVACVEWSVYPFYRHAALRMKARPEMRVGRGEKMGR